MGLRDWLRSKSKAERHRRKVERELWSPLPPVPADEVAELDRLDEGIRIWKTGEFPAIPLAEGMVIAPSLHDESLGPEPATPHLEHDEPIGPAPATAAELFAADPLAAPLHEVPRVNPFYADVLNGQSTWMSEQTRTDLESVTGYWTAGQLKELIERGKR